LGAQKKQKFVEICQRVWHYVESLPKVEIFNFWGRVPTPCTDWCEILHGQVDPRAALPCQISHESVQRIAHAGQKMLIFGLWVKMVRAVFRFTAILPEKKTKNIQTPHFRTSSLRV